MKTDKTILILLTILLGATSLSASAQAINQWRGDETGGDWTDAYKWKLKHAPQGIEAVHFREQNSTISINSTIDLGNGMHLYGHELLLEGNGNINLRSPVLHQRTIAIPASSSGYANLILAGNLSLNAQISLAAKAYGTSAGKGSIMLKDRTTVSGGVSIGNEGCGSGQIIIRDQSSYHITQLELNTLASKGGSAEIHILGGMVRLAIGNNPFKMFQADTSRKIILGDNATLQIETSMSYDLKQQKLLKLIAQKQIIAAPGCNLGIPIIRNEIILLKARRSGVPSQQKPILADTVKKPTSAINASTDSKNTVESDSTHTEPIASHSGYIVFLSALLLLILRPVKSES